MAKQNDDLLMKPSGYRRIIMAGFNLYTENFRRLFKASWLPAAVYALCSGAAGTFTAIKVPEVTLAVMQQMTAPALADAPQTDIVQVYGLLAAAILAAGVVCMVVMTLAQATIVAKLKEHKETNTIALPPKWMTADRTMTWRTLKGCMATWLCILLPLALLGGGIAALEQTSGQPLASHSTTLAVALLTTVIVVGIGALPLFFVLMKYLMNDSEKFWPALSKYYIQGLRHCGLLFQVLLVSCLAVGIAMIVVTLPAFILNTANMTAHTGMLLGDPLGMPSYIKALTFVTFTLCSFMGFYVSAPCILHNYYVYGSIEAKEQERQQQKSEIQ